MKCAGVAGLVWCVIGAGIAVGQSFEVASVKPNPWTGSGSIGLVRVSGNTLSAEHVTVTDLIQFGWAVQEEHVSGGPGWVESKGMLVNREVYQVVAKAGAGSVPTREEFRAMVRALLAERFQLRVRTGQKSVAVYRLVVAKGGPKLQASAAETAFSLVKRSGKVTAKHVTMAQLVENIGLYTGRPLFDETGLTGAYDFEMEFDPGALIAARAEGVESSGNTVLVSLQRQLGLRAESGTGMFDTVVIEHVERPSAN